MAEEKIEEVLGIEDSKPAVSQSNSIFDQIPEYDTSKDPNEASNGLVTASKVCFTFMWLGIILAVIGGLVFLANIGDASEGYSWSAKYQARCAGGVSCLIYGIGDAILTYIFSKILIGLSVMTRASEEYLKEK